MTKKVLIIEDDIFLGDVLVQKLKSDGYETALSRDGASGLKQMADWKPDLVLLDIILPVMNGYEVLEARQKNPLIANIPIIIISNSGQPVEINRALSLGVKDYLVKAQFDPEEVLLKVRLQLGRTDLDSPGVAPSGGATSVPTATGGKLEGRKIMWVEDDKFLSDIIARKLSAQECALFHAANGEEALAHLEKEVPDLVLLDILLPGMDGFEILRRIKTSPVTKAVPVILLSNLGQQTDIDKGKELGAARFLIKATVTLDEIIEEIRKVIAEAGK